MKIVPKIAEVIKTLSRRLGFKGKKLYLLECGHTATAEVFIDDNARVICPICGQEDMGSTWEIERPRRW
jgi:hypothetical protein